MLSLCSRNCEKSNGFPGWTSSENLVANVESLCTSACMQVPVPSTLKVVSLESSVRKDLLSGDPLVKESNVD